ncbi:MAG: hypothetical protein RI894_1485, partial [Bacteroidota bacterium]
KTTIQYGVQVGVQDEPTVVQFHYANPKLLSTVTGLPHPDGTAAETPNNTNMANAEKVGTIWGMAYQKESKKLFAAAFMRRGAMYGTLGTGGIYMIDNADAVSFTPTASRTFIDVKTIGIPTGTDPHPQPSSPTANSALDLSVCDGVAFASTCKIGIGDIDLSEDGKDMFLVNLANRTVYKIRINNPATVPTATDVTAYTTAPWLATPPCTNGVARPFGLKVYRGKLYVGVVCSAENAGGVTNNLYALVYQLDLATNVWNTTPVINQPLNYTKGIAYGGGAAHGTQWYPWFDYMTDPGTAITNYPYPTPVVSGIEFDVNGDMIIGLMDRTGHLFGSGTLLVNSSGNCISDPARSYGPYISATSGGDILRAAKTGASTWTMESNGHCGSVTTSGAGNGQGIGGGEFYTGEFLGGGANAHQETFVGALAIQAGKGQVLGTTFDPFGYDSGGVHFFDNTTGDGNLRYEVYPPRTAPNAGKGNGLGDVELLNPPAPIEIGNRVWTDTNKNGVQDADEAGISGVAINIYKVGTQVGTTTTAADGTWYFNNSNVTMGGAAGLLPNTAYTIRIAAASIPSGQVVTVANVGGAGQPDVRDSDASMVAGNAEIAYTTGVAGQNDHTLDIGFATPLPICVGESYTLTVPAGNTGEWYKDGVATGNTTVSYIVSTAGVYDFRGVPGSCTMSSCTNVIFVNGACATIGNYVWNDTNANGTQDEPTSAGINGIAVELWKETAIGSNSYALLRSTTTANDGSGIPGYYLFNVSEAANYKVKFPTAYGTKILTTQTVTAATDTNSDADAATGFSPAFAINPTGTGVAKDNLTIDAGFTCLGGCVPVTVVKH